MQTTPAMAHYTCASQLPTTCPVHHVPRTLAPMPSGHALQVRHPLGTLAQYCPVAGCGYTWVATVAPPATTWGRPYYPHTASYPWANAVLGGVLPAGHHWHGATCSYCHQLLGARPCSTSYGVPYCGACYRRLPQPGRAPRGHCRTCHTSLAGVPTTTTSKGGPVVVCPMPGCGRRHYGLRARSVPAPS
jgi:hypothetical protein